MFTEWIMPNLTTTPFRVEYNDVTTQKEPSPVPMPPAPWSGDEGFGTPE